MDPHISLVTLGVTDLERAIRFYREGLGLPMRERDPDADVAFFDLAGAWLSLYPRDLLADDATVPAEAAAAGGEVVKAGQEVFWGGYSGYFADPDGHLWEVAWNPGFDLVG
ncbi:VOC family protein [Halomarina litorea]|uniref:VOC family protein n=1 Tax=Halomarina litorea TaxID=2961595 RepID=UPI0020C48365|nr:VOC family protein [Halomarina sp. BCD28]